MGAQERTHLFFISVHTVTEEEEEEEEVRVRFHLGCKWDISALLCLQTEEGRDGWRAVWGCRRRVGARWRSVKERLKEAGGSTARQQGDGWEGGKGRIEASVVRAQRASYWMKMGDTGPGGGEEGVGGVVYGWQIAALERNWAPSMQREWRGGRQQ